LVDVVDRVCDAHLLDEFELVGTAARADDGLDTAVFAQLVREMQCANRRLTVSVKCQSDSMAVVVAGCSGC
jgi:hypothetical protein